MESSHKMEAAKNFFLFFLLYALLYLIAISFGGLIFDLIDKAYPLQGSYYGGFSQGSLRFNLSTLIIGTPIFLYLSRKMHRETSRNESVRGSALKRWLTYITLLITTLLVIGDLIALVNNLLGGETTTRFVLKAVTILVIAVAILFYYLKDVRAQRKNTVIAKPIPTIYFFGTSLLVIIAIILGVLSIESPAIQRARNNDNSRVQDLQQLESAINSYSFSEQTLPESLNDLTLRNSTFVDPITNEPYSYAVLGEDRYELCAVFETSNLDESDEREFYYDVMWLHPSGEHCFERVLTDSIKTDAFWSAATSSPCAVALDETNSDEIEMRS